VFYAFCVIQGIKEQENKPGSLANNIFINQLYK
jgi:hypothetical protein